MSASYYCQTMAAFTPSHDHRARVIYILRIPTKYIVTHTTAAKQGMDILMQIPNQRSS